MTRKLCQKHYEYFIDTPDNIRKKLPLEITINLKTLFQILFILHLSAMLKLKEK